MEGGHSLDLRSKMMQAEWTIGAVWGLTQVMENIESYQRANMSMRPTMQPGWSVGPFDIYEQCQFRGSLHMDLKNVFSEPHKAKDATTHSVSGNDCTLPFYSDVYFIF